MRKQILVLMAGKSIFFDSKEYIYPKPLIEIKGKTMIEWVIRNLEQIEGEKEFIFVVRDEDCQRYFLDRTLKLLTDGNCKVIRQVGEAKGALCSALLAIDVIDPEVPLIFSNCDQIITHDLNAAIRQFEAAQSDCGVICFDSVHPKWSYVRVNSEYAILEASEKKPISRHATTGWLYYRKGQMFLDAAMETIRKDDNKDGFYYVVPSCNQLVLRGLKLRMYPIANHDYHSFYSPQKISDFLDKHQESIP